MEEKIRYGNLLDVEHDRKKEVVINGNGFTIQALFPRDKMQIAALAAQERYAFPSTAYAPEMLDYFERIATIDIGVVKGPEWFQKFGGAKNCPDEDLLSQLYEKIIYWTRAFGEELKKNRPHPGNEKGQVSI